MSLDALVAEAQELVDTEELEALVQRWVLAKYHIYRPYTLPAHLQDDVIGRVIVAEMALCLALTGSESFDGAAKALGMPEVRFPGSSAPTERLAPRKKTKRKKKRRKGRRAKKKRIGFL